MDATARRVTHQPDGICWDRLLPFLQVGTSSLTLIVVNTTTIIRTMEGHVGIDPTWEITSSRMKTFNSPGAGPYTCIPLTANTAFLTPGLTRGHGSGPLLQIAATIFTKSGYMTTMEDLFLFTRRGGVITEEP